ncbi:TetR/AcrR family transcriptional regulator [Pseudogracilibacillus sp. ICA-222130]|uniref:TetR/AcrR family transcriptional regulator n=1 Tax=Pseudogracilibacillus sp. ICA-222130 TaxID=3134655 RepID=UPI0030BA8345
MENSQRQLGRPRKSTNELSTKDTILQIATFLFLEKGYPLISMDDVAQRADVTKATVYYHYKTKDDLFTDAVVKLMERITGGINKIFSTDEPFKVQLHKLGVAHLRATSGMDVNLFMKEARHSLSPEHEAQLKEAEDKMYQAIEDRIQQSIDKKEIPPCNTHLAALLFMSMLLTGKNHEKSFNSLEDLVAQTIEFFWNGLAHQE